MKMGVARYEQALCCTRRGGESTSVAIGCPRSRRISGPYVLACALACACARVFVRLRLCMDAVGMHGACACSAWRRAEGALCGCVRCSDEDSERGSLIGDARSIEHKQLGWGGSGGSSPSRKDAAMTARVSPPSAVVSICVLYIDRERESARARFPAIGRGLPQKLRGFGRGGGAGR